jgi:NADPH-dependent 7-cyano-7-deazaguanine reductase QueF
VTLSTMPVTHSARMACRHRILLPPCCPVSGNPQEGSALTLRYVPNRATLEVYSLESLVRQFIGGFDGDERYPAERNMEGMVQLIAQMAADALCVSVRFRARLVLDAGQMEIAGEACPREASQ